MSPEPHRLQKELLANLAGEDAAPQPTHEAEVAFLPRKRNRKAIAASAVFLMTSAALLASSAAVIAFNLPVAFAVAGAGLTAVSLGQALLAGRRAERKAARSARKTHSSRKTAGTEEIAERGLDRSWEASETPGQVAAMFDALGDMFVAIGPDSGILACNEVFRKATKIDQPVGKSLLETGIVPIETDAGREVRLYDGDTQRIWAWRQTASRDANGKLVTFAIGREVTGERLAREQLAEAKTRAEEASTAKTRFLATVSHEIRTPLNGILGMTHLLSQTKTTPEQAGYLRTVRESGHSLLQLIEDLLDTTSIEAGRFHLRENDCNPRELVQTTCELMAAAAHEKGIEIASHIAFDVPETMTSDAGRLKQILFNLIGNAIKFTEEGGIQVEVDRVDDRLLFSVSDTGSGLKAEDQQRVFGEFERADNSSTRKHGGAGLGLTISARIVQALGGTISVSSTLGEGSRFSFTVPIKQAALASTTRSDLTGKPLEGKSVLLLGPVGPVAETLIRSIRELGGRAERASAPETVRAAIARFGNDVTDLLIDRRIADENPEFVEATARQLADDVARTVLIAPEDSRELKLSPALAAGRWLVRPVRAVSLVNVLGRRDDRDERNRASGVITTPALLRPSDAPTFDILLAEDNPVNAFLVRTMLARLGHRVTLVENGLDLVDAALERPDGKCNFDLVITDLSMPELDGEDAIREIRSIESAESLRRLPIIVLSANGQAATRDTILAAGADGHAEKPVDPEWLTKLVSVTAANGRKAREA
ncbi:response regulator [Pseudohoeflea suaedae]|uniref:histidine kinase n=1 Tax=Pseudohoeflea suaedae TaxID=877384 RepID=A0A4R5PM51_9HYPH|nr:ATP-binding protein [Pseudohoeflea suaedae]TDH38064.1 response regulator [Pseudohoeflea suaedae]